MTHFNQIFSMSTGHELESELIDTCAEFFQAKTGLVEKTVFRFATQEEDKFLGTDAFIYGVPVDFTCNFAGKNYTTDTRVSVELPGIGKIRFGVRTGNGRTRFEMPVLVMGIETGAEIRKASIVRITDAVRAKMEEIVEVGSDSYWNHCDAYGLA